MKMFITDDPSEIEGQFGYTMLSLKAAPRLYFTKFRIGAYEEFNLLRGHYISKEDFVSKAGSRSSRKGDITKRFVIIPETKADIEMLHLCKSAIDYYFYVDSGICKQCFTAYTKFFGVEVE